MSAAPRAVKVTILGREYAFASQGEQADAHVRRVAQLVDERMRETARRAPRQGPLQVAILTGLELVDELLSLQREADSVEEQIAERTSRLSSSLGLLLGDLDRETTSQDDATSSDFNLSENGVSSPRFRTDTAPIVQDSTEAADGSEGEPSA